MSSITLSLFFAAYTLSALLVATNVVRAAGVLNSLILGFGAYVTLSLSYVSYELMGGGLAADCLVALASLVAGVGGGLLWVAQTTQYAVASSAYAEVQHLPNAEASSEFATIFAAIYVSMEAAVKLLTSLTLFGGTSLTAAIGALVGIGAIATGAFLWNPLDIGLGYRRVAGPRASPSRRPGGDDGDPCFCFDATGLRAVAKAHYTDYRLFCLAPLTLGFGYSSALFTDWVDSVVDEERGNGAVALVSAITTVTAGLACLPVNWLYVRGGAKAPVALAVAAYGTLGALILGLGSLGRISTWPNLVAIFALQGVNRAVFENSTKFIFLDTFRGSQVKDAALASIYAHSGFASTITFASLFSENIGLAGSVLLLFALAIAAGFYSATDDDARRDEKKRQRNRPADQAPAKPPPYADRFELPSPGPPILI